MPVSNDADSTCSSQRRPNATVPPPGVGPPRRSRVEETAVAPLGEGWIHYHLTPSERTLRDHAPVGLNSNFSAGLQRDHNPSPWHSMVPGSHDPPSFLYTD